jgi:diguanylate cyclase (GGDEF)-like protein
VTRLWQLLPADNLGKTRLAAVIIGCLALCSSLAQSGSPANSPRWDAVAVLAILLMMASLVRSYVRGTGRWWDSLLLPALVAIGGSGLRDPLATISIAQAMTVVLSLYGGTRLWAVRTAATLVAIPAAVAINDTSLGRDVSWHSPAVLGILPQLLLVSAIMRGIYTTLTHQLRAGARDAVLARTGVEILAAGDLDTVRSVGRAACEDILALSRGVAMIVVRRGPDGLYLRNQAGLPDDLRGHLLPDDVVAEPNRLDRHVPGFRHWRAVTFSPELHVFVGGSKPVAEDIVDAFRTISNQVVLAENAVRSYAELEHRADHDHLTQLPTRAKFFRRLATAVDEQPPGTVALLSIDLDDFKTVNDTYGHGAGDELLIEMAARLDGLGIAGAVPARFGGDEFAVLLTGLSHPEEADRVADLLCRRLIQPVRLTGATVIAGASIGVAVTVPGGTAADLTRSADIAMYAAKTQGKNRVERFDPDRHGDVARHRTLEQHIGTAVDRDEIVLRFAPWVEPHSGRCVGVEALAYWEHPVFGTLPPAELVRLAGRTGDLPALSRHLVRDACTQFTAVAGSAELRLGLQVTGRQLLDPASGADLVEIAMAAGLDPGRLTLEIVDADGIEAAPQLAELAGRGVRIALDAATTATATVSALSRTTVHQLTVDAAQPADLDLVLALSRVLGTCTVMQGVTSAAQFDALPHTGVSAVRGPYAGAPMPAAELAGWLAANTALQGV